MKPCVLLVLVCGGLGSASVPVSRDTIASSLSSLMSPNLCQLKLICALSKTSNLEHSVFMRGISALADLAAGSFLANTTADAFLLQHSLETGECHVTKLRPGPQPPLPPLSRSSRQALQSGRAPVPLLGARAGGRHRGSRHHARPRPR